MVSNSFDTKDISKAAVNQELCGNADRWTDGRMAYNIKDY